MRTEYAVADVFTEVPLRGNPVAVFVDAVDIDPPTMQRLARELNLSETTFVLPPVNGGDARVRIFTPVNELPFAGHPMLGTAAVLAATLPGDRMLLETAMGTIPFDVDRVEDGSVSACMGQPIPTWEPYDKSAELLRALDLGGSTLPVQVYRNGPRHVYVGLPSVEALSAVNPDQRALADHEDVAVNCFAGGGTHWRMRMFSPAYGVAEDAATGSAAGPLAVHLVRHGLAETGAWLEIMQGVEIGRPSVMRARVNGSGERPEAVDVAGSAVVVAHGTFEVP